MNFNNFFIMDFETEHLNLFNSRPWQCGVVISNHKEVLEKKEWWIYWPDLKMSPDAAYITKFDAAIYEEKANPKNNAPTAILPDDFCDWIIPYLRDEKMAVVGQNILGFDVYINDITFRLCGRKPERDYFKRLIDTSLICKGLKMGLKPEVDNLLAWQYKMYHERTKIKTNLKVLCADYDVPYDETRHHVDATYDCELTNEVFQKIKYNILP